jgi:hypothetical protein
VLIKSRRRRAGFEPSRTTSCCTTATARDLALFTYRSRRRPLYPFDRRERRVRGRRPGEGDDAPVLG